jgi:hypothetical protein
VIRSLPLARELALFIPRWDENAVVSSSRAAVLLRLHRRHPPALIEIETVASVKALSGFPHQHRPGPLLQLASLLRRPAPSTFDRTPELLPALNAAPNKRGLSEDNHSAIPNASNIHPDLGRAGC